MIKFAAQFIIDLTIVVTVTICETGRSTVKFSLVKGFKYCAERIHIIIEL